MICLIGIALMAASLVWEGSFRWREPKEWERKVQYGFVWVAVFVLLFGYWRLFHA